MQVTYAAATCANGVYFALPFVALGDPKDFALATATVRGAYHLANALGSATGVQERP